MYFVHQSANDFLTRSSESSYLFPLGQALEHKKLAHCLLGLLGYNLRRDICKINQPGILHKEVETSHIQEHIPTYIQYTCCYWVDHLLCKSSSLTISSNPKKLAPKEDNYILPSFFQELFLYWIEALMDWENVKCRFIM